MARPEAPARVSWREAAKGLAWRRIGVVAAGVFVLAMGAILTFELVTGRAVSTAWRDRAQRRPPSRGSVAAIGA